MENDPAVIDKILRTAKTIAVLGMSDKHTRASHHVGKYLANNGYRVLPVNPAVKEIDGAPCFPDLDAAQAAVQAETGAGPTNSGIDLVDVFRAPEFVPAIVEDVIRLKIPYLWLQDGVVNDEAIAQAQEAGILCVQNDCTFRQHSARPDLHAR
jgi:uncharacterized protein